MQEYDFDYDDDDDDMGDDGGDVENQYYKAKCELRGVGEGSPQPSRRTTLMARSRPSAVSSTRKMRRANGELCTSDDADRAGGSKP